MWGLQFLRFGLFNQLLALSPLPQPASPLGASGADRASGARAVTDSQDPRASSSRATTPQLKVPLPATDVKLISSLQSPTKEPKPRKPRCIFTRPSSNRLRAVKQRIQFPFVLSANLSDRGRDPSTSAKAERKRENAVLYLAGSATAKWLPVLRTLGQ